MADFLPAFDKTIAAEGGYRLSDVQLDRGGRTFAGIASRYHADWPGWEYVNRGRFDDPELISLVRSFYREEFWDPIHGDELIEQRVAESIFDFAVNAGLRTAVKLAQRVSGAKDDGIVGKKTVAAINAMRDHEFIPLYLLEKISRYAEICNRDRTQCKFLLGWINRVLEETTEA